MTRTRTARSIADMRSFLARAHDLTDAPDDLFEVHEQRFFRVAARHAYPLVRRARVVPSSNPRFDLERAGVFDDWFAWYFARTRWICPRKSCGATNQDSGHCESCGTVRPALNNTVACIPCHAKFKGATCPTCHAKRPDDATLVWLRNVCFNATSDAELRANWFSQQRKDVADMIRKPLQPIMLTINRAVRSLKLNSAKLDGSNAFFDASIPGTRPATRADFDAVRQLVDVDVCLREKWSKKIRTEFIVRAFADRGVLVTTWQVAELIQELFDQGLYNPSVELEQDSVDGNHTVFGDATAPAALDDREKARVLREMVDVSVLQELPSKAARVDFIIECVAARTGMRPPLDLAEQLLAVPDPDGELE